jgi:hypothetical protein
MNSVPPRAKRSKAFLIACARSIVAGIVAVHLSIGVSWAQKCDSVGAAESTWLAQHYAPILNFAPGEGYFPTLPFFPAFDEFDHGTGTAPPLADLDRIATLSGRRGSWIALDTMYRRRIRELTAPSSGAVMYRVRGLSEHETGTLWTFLKNDPQAWSRLGAEEYFNKGLRDACFLVVEYYFYYLRDAGLQGHENDMERVSVFLPRSEGLKERLQLRQREPAYAGETDSVKALKVAALASELPAEFAVVAGSGHSTTTPNNVLVVTGQTARNLTPPAVLVERGGHASAPNMPPYTEFNLGLDVNWNLNDNVWGTRDLQAISGRGFLGDYHTGMTLPRDPATSVQLAYDTSKARVDTIRMQEAARYAPEKAKEPPSKLSKGYALIDAELLHRLFAAADSFRRASPDRKDIYRTRVVAIVDDTIRRALPWRFRGLRSLPDSAAVDGAIGRMAAWNRPMANRKGKPLGHDHRVWVAGFYTSGPTLILKRSLYRPAFKAVRNSADIAALVSPGLGLVPGRTALMNVNILFPVFGRVVSVPGIAEFELAAPFRRQSDGAGRNLLIGLLYDRHYKSATSWYVRMSYLKDRALIQRVAGARDFDFGGGLSLMPLLPFVDNLQRFGLAGLAQKLRVRLGVQIDVRDWVPDATTLQWQFLFYQR